MTARGLLGLDVGGTKVAGVAVVDGATVAEVRRPRHEGDGLAAQVVSVARELVDRIGQAPAAIGVAAPGQVDAERGVVEMAVNLGVTELPIGSLIAEALEVPTAVEHDARAVALWLAEPLGPSGSLAYVSVGTGIAAGVVIDGRLVRGAAGLAGEIGHLVADPGGERCACGLAGCLEAIASGPAVARAMARALSRNGGSTTSTGATSAAVYRAAADGDHLARSIVELAATHLAAGIRGLVLAYGVRRVVIGGGVAQAGEAFARPLRRAIDRERAGSTLVARAVDPSAIEVLSDGRPIGALAAVAIARRLAGVGDPHEEVGAS